MLARSHSPSHLTASRPAGLALQSSLRAVASSEGSVSPPTVVDSMKAATFSPWGMTFWSLMAGREEEMKVRSDVVYTSMEEARDVRSASDLERPAAEI